MWIKNLKIKNLRCIKNADIEFSRGLNIIVGQNNSGKSTILLPIIALQNGLPSIARDDLRIDENEASVNITFEDIGSYNIQIKSYRCIWWEYNSKHKNFELSGEDQNGNIIRVPIFPGNEPENFIYPFLSKRKATKMSEQVNVTIADKVSENFENLNAKIDRLTSSDYPYHDSYIKACEDILGIRITTAPATKGKRAGYTIEHGKQIPLSAMGEGVTNVVGLLVNLAISQDKLFIIEEPENDIHPQALKSLLAIIAESSQKNQFIITTHSSLVLRILGAVQDACIFHVTSAFDGKIPTATITQVPDTPDDRRMILHDLGYQMSDNDLWDAWIFFEESSIERIVNQFLLPLFTPSLQGRIRTYSAHSLSEVIPKFEDFNDLFVFLHLSPAYKNRVWVVVDGGNEEKSIIDRLRELYVPKKWESDRFSQLSQHDSEYYYPDEFSENIKTVLSQPSGKTRQEAKKTLLNEVLIWLNEDPNRAKIALETSAKEIIELLRRIEAEILK